jgi:hypothetical protein
MNKFIKCLYKKLTTPKCKHIWKTEDIEFLYSKEHMGHACGYIDIDYYDVYAHHQRCLNCDENRIVTNSELVSSPKAKTL